MEIRVPKPLVRELRAMMRDYPEINFVDESEESQNSQYARILYEALEEFNLLPPVFDTLFAFDSLPVKFVRPVIDLARVRVLNEVMIWMARNDFKYMAGDVQVDLYSRWRAYAQIVPGLSQKAEKMSEGVKFAENVNRAWGASLTEMYDSWRGLESADWLVVNI
jgi:hypothetical protein